MGPGGGGGVCWVGALKLVRRKTLLLNFRKKTAWVGLVVILTSSNHRNSST